MPRSKNQFYGKNLAEFKDMKYVTKQGEEVESKAHHWLKRGQAMTARRSFFETMWKNNLFAFVAFAVHGDEGAKRSFDPDVAPELQGYFNNRFTSYGFRFTDVRYPLEFAVVMRKLATEVKNLPNPDWIVPGAEDQSPSILWKNVYNQEVDAACGDYEDFETFLSKNIFGTAVRWSRMVSYENTVQEPEVDEKSGEVTYAKKTHRVREFKSTTMDLRHVLLDEGCKSADLSDCEDAIVFEYYTKDKGEQVFNDVDFKALGIKTAQKSQIFQDVNDLNGGDQKEFYEVMNCYNKTNDEYSVLINGVEVRRSPIPMRSYRGEKEIPLALFVDHKIPGQPYGYGEPSVVKAFREIKNKNRNLIYDVTKKAAKPTLAIDPNSSFNEETYTWGQDFVRVDPNMMSPIPVQANLDAPLRLDEMTNEDIVIATGVNINDTSAPAADETATKSVLRKESQVALIDLGLHFNSITGFKRLHRINANILQLHLKAPEFDADGKPKKREVITQGKKIYSSQLEDSDVKFYEEEAQGVHSIEYKGSDIDYDFLPILKIGNLAISDQLQKNLEMEGVELMASVAPEAIDQRGMGEFIRERFNFPSTILVAQEDEQGMPTPKPKTDEDKATEMLKRAGALIPDEQATINSYKNAKADQNLVEEQTSPAAMGTGAAGVGV